MIETDAQFEEAKIETVEESEKGWSIKRDDSWSFFVPNTECKTPPEVGETARFYGRGMQRLRMLVRRGPMNHETGNRYRKAAKILAMLWASDFKPKDLLTFRPNDWVIVGKIVGVNAPSEETQKLIIEIVEEARGKV